MTDSWTSSAADSAANQVRPRRLTDPIVVRSGPDQLRQIMAEYGLSERELANRMLLPNPDNITAILDGKPLGDASVEALVKNLDLPPHLSLPLRTIYGCAVDDQWRKVGNNQAIALILGALGDRTISEAKRLELQNTINEIAHQFQEALENSFPNI